MAITTYKKTIMRLFMAAGIIALLFVTAVVFLLPQFINRDMVREKILHLLSDKVSGTVHFQKAEVSFFPLPHVIIRNAGLSIPDKLSGSIATITVYPELCPLLRGDVRLSRINISNASFRLRIPPRKEEKPKPPEEIAALLRSLALGSAGITLSVDNGNIVLERSGRTPASIKGIELGLALANRKESSLLTISRLSSKSPGLSLSAEFRVDLSANLITLEAKGKGMEISPLRSAALGLAGDVPVVQSIFTFLRGGDIDRIAFQSSGKTLEDLGGTMNINIQGNLTKGEVYVPGPRLAFREVEGECDIANGILRGAGLKGALARSGLKDGSLSVGLKGADAPFHMDAAVSADMNDLKVILSNVIKNRDFVEELGHISSISGKASGRLVLGESLASIIPHVDVKDVSFNSVYNRVPYPIEIRKGHFVYNEKGAAVKDLDGAVGKSLFSGLNAQISTGANPRLAILAGKADMDTEEIHRWLSSYDKLEESLGKIKSLSGRLNISSITFQGLVTDSRDWKFNAAGSVEKLLVHTSLLPGPLSINSGRFEAREGQLIFSNADTGFLDASTLISGSLNTSLDKVREGDTRFSGTVGPKALQWIKTTFSVPEYVRTDQSVAVSGGRLTWQNKEDIAFRGSLKTANNQSVALDLLKGRDSLQIRELELQDAASRAWFTLDIRGEKIRAGYRGRLDTSSIAGLITTPQAKGGLLQGDITAEFKKGGFSGAAVQGWVQGEKIVLPWKNETPLRIDSIDMSADKGNISLGSVRLRLGGSIVSLKGNVKTGGEGLVVDLDASSDRILWDDILKQDRDSDKDEVSEEIREKVKSVRGVIRLTSGIFEYNGFQVAPLAADILLGDEKTSIRVKEARPCGIGTTGDIILGADDIIDLDLRLEAKDQELKPTVLCLSKSRGDATGSFTLAGHIKGHGKAEELKKTFRGKIELAAKKGTIYRYKTLDSVLDFVNNEEELKGQLPDLDRSELSYELFKIKASLGKGSMDIEEAIMESARVQVVGQGTLNLVDGQLDLNVMVAPLRPVNKVIGNTPIIGALLGGTVISVPVRVTGTTTDPKVTYLSPSAVAYSLAGMMKRTLNLPVNILSPLFPKVEKQGK